MPVVASILTPLYIAFSWCMQQLYSFFSNYGFVIIFFTLILRALMIPLGINQHKTMLRTQALAPQMDDLKRIYGKDRQGLQMATMELHKKNHISQFGGCVFSLIPILIIWPIYRMVSAPLQYIAGASEEGIRKTAEYLQGMGQITDSQLAQLSTVDLPVVHALQNHAQEFAHTVREGWLDPSHLIDLHFLGVDLGVYPSLSPSTLFGAEWSTYLPVLLIVALAVGTTFLSSKIMEWTNPMYRKLREDKARAKNNPARTEPTDMTQQGMMKGMKYTMPLFTLVFSLSMPVAMALYWVIGNIMMIVQQLVLYRLYTKPYQEQKLKPAQS